MAKGKLPEGKMVTPEQVAAIKRLDEIGREIEVKLVKADKANDMLISVNQLLVEAEALCTKFGGNVMGFSVFKEKFCPSLGRSAAYEVRAVLLGKKTKEQLAAENRGRQQKHRDKVKERNGQNPLRATDDLPPDVSADLRMAVEGNEAARQRLLDAGYTQSEDGSTGKPMFTKPEPVANDNVIEVVVERPAPTEPQVVEVVVERPAPTEPQVVEAVEVVVEQPPTKLKPTVAAFKDTHEKISARALAAGKSWLDENLKTMTTADRAGLFHFFKFHPEMVGVKRVAA
jgi:hypothetical protein